MNAKLQKVDKTDKLYLEIMLINGIEATEAALHNKVR